MRQLGPGGEPTLITAGGLARRHVDLFWPLAAERGGFANPNQPPTFLTLETAQYYMAALADPLIENERLFDSLTLDRNRLYSQIRDNLNKAALAGFSSATVGRRLSAAWTGDSSQLHIYSDAQRCADLFRAYCLEHNLLDFSLQVEVFRDHLWPDEAVRAALTGSTGWIIADNLEEDSPFAHRLLAEWIPSLEGALLVYDQGAGYRTFLSADPQGARQLIGAASERHILDKSFVTPPALEQFGSRVGRALSQPIPLGIHESAVSEGIHVHQGNRFYPDMLNDAAARIAELVKGGIAPGEIAILSPFLSDSLRYGLTSRLDQLGIPWQSQRPSRPFRSEPATACLLTLTGLAMPDLKRAVSLAELTSALVQAIEGCDLVRASLLAQATTTAQEISPNLQSWERIRSPMRDRITHRIGEKYELLRAWLEQKRARPPELLDFFISTLFGELLSRPGFGFHNNYDAGSLTESLVRSFASFRDVLPELAGDPVALISQYFELLESGLITALYPQSWQEQPADAVTIAPAMTFLLANRPVKAQLWLEVASDSWFRRLYQPLTHPYVLSASWREERKWTDADEDAANRSTLYRLIIGLLRRCSGEVHLFWSELAEEGWEQRGMLLRALYQLQVEGGLHA